MIVDRDFKRDVGPALWPDLVPAKAMPPAGAVREKGPLGISV